jgi:hypothetical protein
MTCHRSEFFVNDINPCPPLVMTQHRIVAYKRCGLDTQYKEKMVPGMNTKCHAITGTNPCTLYEVKVAACANEGQGLFSVPVIIRTGGRSLLL